MLSHMKVHDSINDSEIRSTQNDMLNPNMWMKGDMFNALTRPRNEYDAPMNLVVTEQNSIAPKMYTPWPNLDLHDGYAPFQ